MTPGQDDRLEAVAALVAAILEDRHNPVIIEIAMRNA